MANNNNTFLRKMTCLQSKINASNVSGIVHCVLQTWSGFKSLDPHIYTCEKVHNLGQMPMKYLPLIVSKRYPSRKGCPQWVSPASGQIKTGVGREASREQQMGRVGAAPCSSCTGAIKSIGKGVFKEKSPEKEEGNYNKMNSPRRK